MSKKSPVLGAILGFFILGLFYSTGFNKKGVIAVIALVFVSWGVGLASTELSTIVAVVGAYLGYKWVKEHNAMVEEGTSAE